MNNAKKNRKERPLAGFISHFSSIYVRTALFSWVVSIVTILIFLIYIIPQQKQVLLDTLDTRTHAVTSSLRNNTAAAMTDAGDDNELVKQCMEVIKNDKQIAYIVLAENDGSTLVCMRERWNEEKSNHWNNIPEGLEFRGNIRFSNLTGSDVFQHSGLFNLPKGRLGWIHIGFSLDEYHVGMRAVIVRTIYVALIGALFGLLMSLRHARRLVRPIFALEAAADCLSQGNLNARAEVHSANEIGHLADSFNKMAQSIHDREVFVRSHNENLAQLVAEKTLQNGEIFEAAKRVCEVSADTLGVDFVSVWLFDEKQETLKCLNEFNRADGTHSQEGEIEREEYKDYFHALEHVRRVLAVRDVNSDPRTLCLAESYLQPKHVTSMIDAGIQIAGELKGVICNEHTGKTRSWTLDEENFAGSVADLMALALEERDRNVARKELLAAKEAAEAASEAKSRFFANVSHEIRTPLNGVVGMLKLLRESSLDDKQKQFVDRGILSSDALLSAINDVLDYSKMEAGKFEIENLEFNPIDVVENVVDMFAQASEEKGLELVCDIDHAVPAIVHGDPSRIGQILINLVSNAIKFTDRQGDVVVRVYQEDEDDKTARIRFEVRDTGKGVSEKEQERIFEPFHQEDSSTTRRFGGTGLGLSICRQLVGFMEGEIQMTSRVDFGSTFWFSIPFGKHKGVVEPRDGTRYFEKLCDLDILVVDDHSASCEVVSGLFANWGYQTSEANDGASALTLMQKRAAEGRAFDLAVIDWNMPGMSGKELGCLIKNDPQLTETPLIMLCSSTEISECPDCNVCLPKPIRQSRLYDAILNIFDPMHKQGVALIANEPSPSVSVHASEVKILLAEDNEINQEIVYEVLRKYGYSCDIVATGREAVEAVSGGEYDLVFMDCMMPEMDGYEATRRIRDYEQNTKRHTPIVALTANAMKGDYDRCLIAGMDDYLGKPLDPILVMETIIKWCANPDSLEKPMLGNEGESDAEPVFDRDELLSRCMGNEALVEKLIVEFLAQIDADVRLIEEAISVADMEKLEHVVHRIKGSSANLSFGCLNAAITTMEHNVHAGNLDQVSTDFYIFIEEVARLRKFFDTKRAA